MQIESNEELETRLRANISFCVEKEAKLVEEIKKEHQIVKAQELLETMIQRGVYVKMLSKIDPDWWTKNKP